MNKQCDVVRDLLPLYVDNTCSNASTEMIEEHLAQCDECSDILHSMKSNDYEKALQLDKESIIAHHEKVQKRRAAIFGGTIAGILCIPIIACLISIIIIDQTLDKFFIILTSLMLIASVTVVPLTVNKRKKLWTLSCLTISLLLMIFAVSNYTKGSWFPLVATSVLFSMSIIFAPYVIRSLSLPFFLKHHKGLLVLGIDTILYIAVLICSAVYIHSTIPLSSWVDIGFIWIVFLICRYTNINKLMRAGIASFMIGIYSFSVDKLLGETPTLPAINLIVWNSHTIEGNIKWIILFGGIIVGVICSIISIVKQNTRQ